jgi:hypothetical protein
MTIEYQEQEPIEQEEATISQYTIHYGDHNYGKNYYFEIHIDMKF